MASSPCACVSELPAATVPALGGRHRRPHTLLTSQGRGGPRIGDCPAARRRCTREGLPQSAAAPFSPDSENPCARGGLEPMVEPMCPALTSRILARGDAGGNEPPSGGATAP